MNDQGESPGQATPTGLFDLTPETLKQTLVDAGEKAFRAQQVLDWVYRKQATSYGEMTNLAKTLRAELARACPVYQSQVARRQESSDGTTKLLLAWPDGATSECVLIPDQHRRTACLSTQVGCPVGCAFCASGIGGLKRQLSAGQIVEQAMRVAQLCEDDTRLSNIVLMGIGEPLANYDATVAAIRTINAEWGLAIGARKITVSTVGIPTRIRQLAGEGLQITLALSLHAPTDSLRQRIIPWAQRVSIEELIEAGKYYFDHTGREITLEYILLGRVNDEEHHAIKLTTIARKMRSNVNLIAYNPVGGLPYEAPTEEAVDRFANVLRGRGVNVHRRRSRGADIDAACGQLRRASQ